MNIVSWNVNGLRAVERNGYFAPFLKGTKPDIFCFQEVKALPEQLPESVLHVPGYSAYFCPARTKKGYSGVALYTRIEPIAVIYGLGIEEFDAEGRLIGAEYEDFWLINCYFPNGGRGPERLDYKLRYYAAFLAFCEKLRASKPVIFCGDVNTAHTAVDLARPKENQNTSGFMAVERAWIDTAIEVGYIDTFRHLNPEVKDAYTYWDTITRARDRNVGWRIDYFFCSQELLGDIKKSLIHPTVFGSDHCPISVVL